MRSGPLAPILTAVLVPDPARRPSAEQLDAMFAHVESGGSVGAFQQTIPAPRMPAGPAAQGYDEWLTRKFGSTGQNPMPVTDQLPGGSGPRGPINPYGNGDPDYAYNGAYSPEAAQRYRSKAFRLTTISTVAVLGIMGASVWFSTQAENHAGHLADNNAATNVPTFSMPSSPGTKAALASTSQAPTTAASSSSSAADSGGSTATQHLLTPAGVRAVIKQIFAVSGGNRVVSMTVYDDHASFDVVKKDDPGVYDTYDFVNGKAGFSMTGNALDQGEPALDPYTVNWDALPGLLKDADSSLNVKNPKYHYVVVDSDIIDHTLSMRVYIGDDYRSGFLSADLKGKITERYPQK